MFNYVQKTMVKNNNKCIIVKNSNYKMNPFEYNMFFIDFFNTIFEVILYNTINYTPYNTSNKVTPKIPTCQTDLKFPIKLAKYFWSKVFLQYKIFPYIYI